MAIKVLINTTEATSEELRQYYQIIQNKESLLNKLFKETNVDVVELGEKEKKIAEDNGCSLSIGLDSRVFMGYYPREMVENMEKLDKMNRMSIKIIINKSEATSEELARYNELMKDRGFFFWRLFEENNIEIIELGEKDKEIAEDNGYRLSVMLDTRVITGLSRRDF